MTKEEKIRIKKDRLAQLEANGKNFKSPGVIRRLTREIRNLEG